MTGITDPKPAHAMKKDSSRQQDSRRTVGILIPVYNEEEVLPILFNRLEKLVEDNPAYNWTVMFVNDGSTDGSLQMLRRINKRDSRFHYIDLSRNFGKEIAMLAGLDTIDADCVVILDADLQDPPELIPDMLKYWQEGYDDVYARRADRGRESWIRKKLSLVYYNILARLTSTPVLQNTGDFRLLDRECVEALRQLRETQRYTKGLFCWIGFNKKEILFNRADRAAGKSHWSFRKLLSLGIEGITSSSTVPLKIASLLGLIISPIAIVYMIWIIIKTLVFGEDVQGFPTLMVTMLFLGGVQLLSIGIIGEYVGRIFMETKRRPTYFIRETDSMSATPRNGNKCDK